MNDRKHRASGIRRLIREANRRRVLRVAGLYVIGAWVILQIADVVFPGLGIPEGAIRALLIAALLGFPVALVFGWMFDIGPDGIRRTRPDAGETAPVALKATDYAILAVFLLVAGVIVYNATRDVLEAPRETAPEVASAQDQPPEEMPKLENSIAVLPFANLSPNPDNEFFCDGIAEEILNRLGSARELNIIGRTSSFAFKGRDVAIPRIAAALGVRYLLQGSVRRAGNQLRISAQLLDDGGLQLWNESFDREIDDVFAIQKEIAEHVAATVVPHISLATPQGRLPVFEAYEKYLQGRDLLHKRQVSRARPILRAAVALDPAFAEAYAELAVAELIGGRPPEEYEGFQGLIDQSLELKPGLLRALEAQGLLFMQTNQFGAAESVFRNILAEDPDRSDTLLWLHNTLNAEGKPEEAKVVLGRAHRLDPLHATITMIIAEDYWSSGRTEKATALLNDHIMNVPDTRYAYTKLADFYRSQGRLLDVIAIYKRAALNRAIPHYFPLGFNYAALGDWPAARYWLERSRREYPDMFWNPYMEGNLAMWQGRYEETAEIMQRTHGPNPQVVELYRGEALSVAGRHGAAIAVLEPILVSTDVHWWGADNMAHWQALAWAYLQTGQSDQADPILEALENDLREQDRNGSLASMLVESYADIFYRDALNARMMGKDELALDRLERAADQGWADYYIHHHDPRWDELRDHPRFKAVMADVKARVDAMATEMARIDAETDFKAQLDAVMAEQ